mmetsp:Transcript_29118/g.53116  ORF Transcript_29118/g.53116 Transcript_29118/m.53116 type:complete len:662 (-) Transcript_29118:126-2111(-)
MAAQRSELSVGSYAPWFWSFSFLIWQAFGQSCSEDGLLARSSAHGKWPSENPSLVAPVTLLHQYEVYKHPLDAVLTPEGSYLVELPPDFVGGFTLNASCNFDSTCTTAVSGDGEAYKLRSIEIRRPQHVSSFSTSEIIEVVLLHKSEDASTWAAIIVPYEMDANDDAGRSLLTMTEKTTMATAIGDTCAFNVEADQDLNVSSAFDDAFLQHWSTLPTSCPGKSVVGRLFRRRTAMSASRHAMQRVLDGLASFYHPAAMTVLPTSWLVNTWPVGSADPPKAQVVAQTLDEAQQLLSSAEQRQSDAVAEVRERKVLMDEAMRELAEDNCSYPKAEAARNDLKQADNELSQLQGLVERLSKEVFLAQTTVWDAGHAAVATVNTDAASSVLEVGERTAHEDPEGDHLNKLGCSSLAQSPVSVNSDFVLDPETFLPDLKKPFHVRAQSEAEAPVGLSRVADRVRIAHDQSGAANLGVIDVEGASFGIDYIDILTPAEHAVDGIQSAAELQLVHVAPKNSIVVSLRLQTRQEDNPNSILSGLLSHLKDGSSSFDLQSVLQDSHPALQAGEIADYFRYDGTLTMPPCSTAHWYLATALGDISHEQVAALRNLTHRPVGLSRPVFKAPLVMRGAQHLLNRITLAGHERPRTRQFLQRSDTRHFLRKLQV